MPPVLSLLLLVIAAVLFALGACSVPMGRFNPVAGGLLALTVAVWLGPALAGL